MCGRWNPSARTPFGVWTCIIIVVSPLQTYCQILATGISPQDLPSTHEYYSMYNFKPHPLVDCNFQRAEHVTSWEPARGKKWVFNFPKAIIVLSGYGDIFRWQIAEETITARWKQRMRARRASGLIWHVFGIVSTNPHLLLLKATRRLRRNQAMALPDVVTRIPIKMGFKRILMPW